MSTLKLQYEKSYPISPKLYGIFFEDINFSIDGGINNNQVINHSFEFIYGVQKKAPFPYSLRKKWRRKHVSFDTLPDYLRYWQIEGGSISLGTEGAPAKGKHYAIISAKGAAAVYNLGYNAGAGVETIGIHVRQHENCCAIGVKKGERYRFQALLRSADYNGSITVNVVAADGTALTDSAVIEAVTDNWQAYSLYLTAAATAVGKLKIAFNGTGAAQLDEVYFGATDALGEDDSRYSGGKLRRDLVESLRALKPAFVRFPGGCIVEGYDLDNSYRWKNTVGEAATRNVRANLWGESQRDKGYLQSYQIGFYEYLLLCEELNAEPLPIVNAGMACQFRITSQVRADSEAFQTYIDDAIDLIDFCNADPSKNKWAKLRADSGHPAPFNLKMIGLGNENFGPVYGENFLKLREAVEKHAPYMTTLYCVGGGCYKVHDYAELRKVIDANFVGHDSIVDDHFYRTPQWVLDNVGLYDDYDRSKAPIFLGEWAANNTWEPTESPNTYLSAFSEAAFMTALERDADIVKMSSYAPLFSRMAGEQWRHNLINFNSLAVLHTANYYVQQLFAANYGSTFIPAECSQNGLYQSATTDGEYLYLKLVNSSATEVQISIESKKELFEAQLTYITGEDAQRNTLGYDAPKGEEPIAPVTLNVAMDKPVTLKGRSVNVIKAKIK